ncbi:30S ribosomal protein S6 [Rickettsiales endosymbiont of Paramecium tredecaurelia]|nr:30S ribosomal protein S6 [Candidatus Sarmatiella mevalonica]MBL3284481.1 30S ribosomal protein S6 [Candidatus Sarmatiella mevalonica]
MNSYELVFIVRQNISSTEIDKITAEVTAIIAKHQGSVVRSEYWGLRHLAYKIGNNKRGHYSFCSFKGKREAVLAINKIMRANEDVIRHMVLKRDKVFDQPSCILKEGGGDVAEEKSIDITVAYNNARA